jgi:membrane AbrB-like protein
MNALLNMPPTFVIRFALTLAVGGIFGFIFMRLKVPNGLRIGALLGAALLSVFFRQAFMPSQTRFLVQVVAGALVACTVEQSDLRRLPLVIKPTLIALASFLLLNLALGSLIYAVSPMDRVTAMLAVVPGGITDIPIIAADMGADTPQVALVQLVRYIAGVAFFPSMILAYDNAMEKRRAKNLATATLVADLATGETNLATDETNLATNLAKDETNLATGETAKQEKPRIKSSVNSMRAFVCTFVVALIAGFIGRLTGFPAGAFLFSALGVLVLKLKFDFAYIPNAAKNCALLVSGCYIGSLVTMQDVLGFRFLALPILIVLLGYIANCFITGKIISRTCSYTRKEGMLTTTPAGASDIALNSSDIGVTNTDIIIIQVVRALVAVGVFPQLINLMIMFLRLSPL